MTPISSPAISHATPQKANQPGLNATEIESGSSFAALFESAGQAIQLSDDESPLLDADQDLDATGLLIVAKEPKPFGDGFLESQESQTSVQIPTPDMAFAALVPSTLVPQLLPVEVEPQVAVQGETESAELLQIEENTGLLSDKPVPNQGIHVSTRANEVMAMPLTSPRPESDRQIDPAHLNRFADGATSLRSKTNARPFLADRGAQAGTAAEPKGLVFREVAIDATKSVALDAKTQLFMQNLDQSLALNRHIGQSVQSRQDHSALLDPGHALSPQIAPAAPVSFSVMPMAQAVMMGAPIPVSHPNWAQAMSQQVVNFVKMDEKAPQIAELRLDPPELGPIRVSISINDGVAHASFVSAQASVRQLIEQSLPQLAQSLEQAGIELGQTQVGERDSGESNAYAQNDRNKSRDGLSKGQKLSISTEEPSVPSISRSSLGLVRTYA